MNLMYSGMQTICINAAQPVPAKFAISPSLTLVTDLGSQRNF
jgi:hypothetical protein